MSGLAVVPGLAVVGTELPTDPLNNVIVALFTDSAEVKEVYSDSPLIFGG